MFSQFSTCGGLGRKLGQKTCVLLLEVTGRSWGNQSWNTKGKVPEKIVTGALDVPLKDADTGLTPKGPLGLKDPNNGLTCSRPKSQSFNLAKFIA